MLQRFVIGGSQSVLGVSLLHGSCLVIVILIDGSNIKHICKGGFRISEFTCF